MSKKIEKMTDEEYENYSSERQRLDKEIMNTSLLLNEIKIEHECPFCHSNIGTINEIRDKHIQDMQGYNKFTGHKYYIAHIEGKRKWEI